MEEEFEKESRDPMIRRLVGMFHNDLTLKNLSFCIQGEPLQIDEISSHNGLLPLFCYKAAIWAENTLKKPLPLFFEHDKTALIEVVPMTDGSKDNNLFSLWAHFLHFSLEEEVNRLKRDKKLVDGNIPLDELYTDWHQAIKSNRFTVRPNGKMIAKSTSGR